jgi:PmbA protein
MTRWDLEAVTRFVRDRADDWALRVTDRRSTQVKFARDDIATTNLVHSDELYAFVAKGKRTLGARFTRPQGWRQDVERLLDSLQSADENGFYSGIADGAFGSRAGGGVRPLDDLKLIDLAEAAVNRARELGASGSSGMCAQTVEDVSLRSSEGANCSERRYQLYLSIRCFGKENSGHDCSISSSPDLRWEVAVRGACDLASWPVRKERVEPGPMRVVFGPLAFGGLVNEVARHLSASQVVGGQSCLAGQVGTAVAPNGVGLHDDPAKSGGTRTGFDDEGRRTARTSLIDRGVLRSYLCNHSLGKHLGAKSTSNARHSDGGLFFPPVSAYSLEFEGPKGLKSLDDLERDAKPTLVVTNLWYTRYQSSQEGSFSTIPRDATMVVSSAGRRGVKDIRLNDTLPRLLSAIEATSNREQWALWWGFPLPVRTPWVMVDAVRVSTPAG